MDIRYFARSIYRHKWLRCKIDSCAYGYSQIAPFDDVPSYLICARRANFFE